MNYTPRSDGLCAVHKPYPTIGMTRRSFPTVLGIHRVEILSIQWEKRSTSLILNFISRHLHDLVLNGILKFSNNVKKLLTNDDK